jgi:hypothetical protein
MSELSFGLPAFGRVPSFAIRNCFLFRLSSRLFSTARCPLSACPELACPEFVEWVEGLPAGNLAWFLLPVSDSFALEYEQVKFRE